MEKKEKHTFRRRYMKDYELRVELDKKGREVKVPYYTGLYYSTVWEESVLRSFRKLCIVLSIATLVALLGSLWLVHNAMKVIFVIMPAVLALFPATYLIMGAFRLPVDLTPMKSDDLEYGFERVKRSSIGVLVLSGVSLLCEIGYLLFFFKDGSLRWEDFVHMGLLLIAAASSALLFKQVRTARITGKEEERSVPEE